METKSLVNIVSESLNLEKMLIESGGEITPEIEQFLAVNEKELSEKVDGYHMIIDRFEALKNHYKQKSEYFNLISSQCGQASKRLKDNIKYAMVQLGVDEIKGNDMRFKLSQGAGSLILEDEEMIPVEYKHEEVVTHIKKDDLKKDIKDGKVVAGARVEFNPSIRAYANLPEKKTKKELKNVE